MKTLNNAKLVLAAALGLAAFAAMAQDLPKGTIAVTPDKIAWKPSPRVAGLEISPLTGDSTKAGVFREFVKFPPNFKILPHTHPDDRFIVIVSGTWYIGFGDKFDESKMIALPPGSFYSEQARTPHYVMTKGDGALLQITGTGPTATSMLAAPGAK